MVQRDFSSLRKIEVQGNIFADHRASAIFEALLEVKMMRSVERMIRFIF